MGVASDGGLISRQPSPTSVMDVPVCGDIDTFVVSIEDQEGPADELNSIGSIGTFSTSSDIPVDVRNHPQADIGVNTNFMVYPYHQLDQTAPAIDAHGPGIYHQNHYTGVNQTPVVQAMPTNYGTGEQGQSPFGGGTESASRPPSLRPPPSPSSSTCCGCRHAQHW